MENEVQSIPPRRRSRLTRGNGVTTDFAYDQASRLTLISHKKPDGTGNRTAKTVNRRMERYLYDGDEILCDYDKNGSFAAMYVNGPIIDERLALLRHGELYYYLTDHLGSVREMVDSRGSISNSYDYEAFGSPLITEENVHNRFRFAGRDLDKESLLGFFRDRMYEGKLGRFESVGWYDKLFGYNVYIYPRLNPIQYTDPYGLYLFTPYSGSARRCSNSSNGCLAKAKSDPESDCGRGEGCRSMPYGSARYQCCQVACGALGQDAVNDCAGLPPPPPPKPPEPPARPEKIPGKIHIDTRCYGQTQGFVIIPEAGKSLIRNPAGCIDYAADGIVFCSATPPYVVKVSDGCEVSIECKLTHSGICFEVVKKRGCLPLIGVRTLPKEDYPFKNRPWPCP